MASFDGADMLGWLSSIVLVVTLFTQIRKQWHDETSRGVSPFLFIGQLAASIGFLAYSVLIENWVFTVTNSLTALAAVLGLWITYRHRKRGMSIDAQTTGTDPYRNATGPG